MTGHRHDHLGAERIVKPTVLRPIVDPNVTAFVAVVLVVLCGFLALVAMQRPSRVDVQLPASTPQAVAAYYAAMEKSAHRCDEDFVVRITADGSFEFNVQTMARADLDARLRSIFERISPACSVLYIQPAANTRYGDVVAIVDAAQTAGAIRVVMLSADEWKTSR